jgi:hypothetical protein
MAILQALLALISRSLGKVVTALFGWSVLALFGQTTDKEKTFLSALVGAAVLWPLLVVGIAFPRAAAFLVAFIPAHAAIPAGVMRIVWLALALLIPVSMGLVVAARATGPTHNEPVWHRILRGFPITVALASAFVITFLTIPLLRVVNIVRRREDVSIPALTDTNGYHDVAKVIAAMLVDHGFPLERGEPPRHSTLPSRVLMALGGKAFRGYIPEKLEYYHCAALEVTFNPSGFQLRGLHGETARAHALIDEALARTPAVQTTAPAAQELERAIRRVWAVYADNPTAHASSRRLHERLQEITAEARRLDLAYADWQILYRQLLQLSRALAGEPQLIDAVDRAMHDKREAPDGLVAKAIWLAEKAVNST